MEIIKDILKRLLRNLEKIFWSGRRKKSTKSVSGKENMMMSIEAKSSLNNPKEITINSIKTKKVTIPDYNYFAEGH